MGNREERRWRAQEEEARASAVIYPYYVEVNGLRELARSVKLDLPTARKVTKSKRLSFGSKGTRGEAGQSETEEFDSQVPLLELAAQAERSWSHDGAGPALGVATAPYVSDERVLSNAIEQIERDFAAQSQTAELLSRVKEVFGDERVEALAVKKRDEFKAIADRNQLMVFKGQFAYREDGPPGSGPTLKLTHFNPSHGYSSPRAAVEGDTQEAALIPVPDGIGLTVVLPDEKSLRPAGRERIMRRAPFYAGIIAHSSSFNEETGTLTCSAWAIWGESTPNWNELEPGYPFMGPGARPGVGC